jgi:hypothetical protein
MKKILLAVLFLGSVSKAAINTKYDVMNITLMDKAKIEFNGVGVGAVVPASTTDFPIDYDLTDDNFLTGAKMMATGGCGDDRIKVQVVFGTTMIKQFIDWYSMDMDTQLPIPSKIPASHPLLGAGKIRALYTNTCTIPVKVRVNYHLYKILE